VSCFVAEGIVVDEGRRKEGREAIRQWRTGPADYGLEVQVLDYEHRGAYDGLDQHDLQIRATGSFPGGVVWLTFKFGLETSGRIGILVIEPVGDADKIVDDP
jgi:hypothetical protein